MKAVSPFKLGLDGSVITLREGMFTIGRGPTCDLVLEDNSLSRQHAVLHISPEKLIVEDLSRNGLQVNGEGVEAQHELKAGDRIQVGRFQLAILRDDPSRPTASTDEW